MKTSFTTANLIENHRKPWFLSQLLEKASGLARGWPNMGTPWPSPKLRGVCVLKAISQHHTIPKHQPLHHFESSLTTAKTRWRQTKWIQMEIECFRPPSTVDNGIFYQLYLVYNHYSTITGTTTSLSPSLPVTNHHSRWSILMRTCWTARITFE